MTDLLKFDPVAFKAEIMAGVKDLIAWKETVLERPQVEVKAEEPETNVKEVITPELKQMLGVKADLVKQLANPRMVLLRGQRSTQWINQTQESLNAVNAEIKDYRQGNTRIRVK